MLKPEVLFCLRCQERLIHYVPRHGLPRCSHCDAEWDPANPETYNSGPPLSWKYPLPGLSLAVVVGVLSYLLFFKEGRMGSGAFLGIPLTVGCLAGYFSRAKIWINLILGITAVACVAMTLVSLNIAGIFCGLVGAIIFLGPALVGVCLGAVLRNLLKTTSWSQRFYLPLFLVALPFLIDALERLLPCGPLLYTVTTEGVFHASAKATWDSIQFYEQVRHDPPLFLRLALPRPIRAEGSKSRVGDVVRCLYDRGYLVKQITRRDEGRLLEFKVTEQKVHFERDVALVDGSFRVEPVSADLTRVAVETRYERRLFPAWLWEPIERKVVRALHEHVLEGMRRKAEGAEPELPSRRLPTDLGSDNQ